MDNIYSSCSLYANIFDRQCISLSDFAKETKLFHLLISQLKFSLKVPVRRRACGCCHFWEGLVGRRCCPAVAGRSARGFLIRYRCRTSGEGMWNNLVMALAVGLSLTVTKYGQPKRHTVVDQTRYVQKLTAPCRQPNYTDMR